MEFGKITHDYGLAVIRAELAVQIDGMKFGPQKLEVDLTHIVRL